jgi:predicted aldo/keto reductase-like oxidoreductase
MGVMNANNPEIIKQAYDVGIRLFDTASIYQGGRNEEMIGRVVKQFGLRDDVIIVTKTNARPDGGVRMSREEAPGLARSKDEIRDQYVSNFGDCLKRLQTDHVDILLCHGTSSVEAVNDPGVTEALERIKSEKTARFVGIGTHSNQAEVIDATVDAGLYDVVLVAFNFTMADNEAIQSAMKRAAEKGLGIIGMKTQTGGRRRETSEPVNHTAALKYVLRHEFITTAIPGFTNLDHLNENFEVARDLDYTAEEESFLSDKNVKTAFGFCQQCGECSGTCRGGADIPALMRTHMYAAQYANFHQARGTYDEIPIGKDLEACVSCGACTAQCARRSVDIARSIEELKTMYA